MSENIFSALPANVPEEVFQNIVSASNVRIERIVSSGGSSPESGWYDQEEDEWVIILEGSGAIRFEDGREVILKRGDYITIPAHSRHRVLWTDKTIKTIWLAVFYRQGDKP